MAGMALTTEEAAAILGVERYQLSRYLQSIHKPPIEMAYQIEDVFGVSPRLWTLPVDDSAQ